MLKDQQIGLPFSSNWLNPFNSSGQFALALAEALAFFLGFTGRGGPCLVAPSSTGALAADFEDPLGKGSMCILMRGS